MKTKLRYMFLIPVRVGWRLGGLITKPPKITQLREYLLLSVKKGEQSRISLVNRMVNKSPYALIVMLVGGDNMQV